MNSLPAQNQVLLVKNTFFTCRILNHLVTWSFKLIQWSCVELCVCVYVLEEKHVAYWAHMILGGRWGDVLNVSDQMDVLRVIWTCESWWTMNPLVPNIRKFIQQDWGHCASSLFFFFSFFCPDRAQNNVIEMYCVNWPQRTLLQTLLFMLFQRWCEIDINIADRLLCSDCQAFCFSSIPIIHFSLAILWF